MFIRFCREYALPLGMGIIMALIWSNISMDSYLNSIHRPLWDQGVSVYWLVDNVFMAFFFAMGAVELKRNLGRGGALYPPKKAVTPLMATVGGVLLPVVVFKTINHLAGCSDYEDGWGLCTSTDIALAWIGVRSIFGSRHPAVSFLLLLAMADDMIGILIIALFYPAPGREVDISWLLLSVAGTMATCTLRGLKVSDYTLYILLCGTLSWAGLYKAHLHPALCFVFIVPFMPREPVLRKFDGEVAPYTEAGLFFFGLVNGGIALSRTGDLTWIVLASALIGKTLGILIFSKMGERLGFPLPSGIGNRQLAVIALLGSMGLTVALFIADSAFPDPELNGMAKMGALLTSGLLIIVYGFRPIIRKLIT